MERPTFHFQSCTVRHTAHSHLEAQLELVSCQLIFPHTRKVQHLTHKILISSTPQFRLVRLDALKGSMPHTENRSSRFQDRPISNNAIPTGQDLRSGRSVEPRVDATGCHWIWRRRRRWRDWKRTRSRRQRLDALTTISTAVTTSRRSTSLVAIFRRNSVCCRCAEKMESGFPQTDHCSCQLSTIQRQRLQRTDHLTAAVQLSGSGCRHFSADKRCENEMDDTGFNSVGTRESFWSNDIGARQDHHDVDRL